MFFNLSIDTGKKEMIRAVVEGIMFHQKWLLQSIQKNFPVSEIIGFAGGGALSSFMARLMADILEHPVRCPLHPQNCGAAGAALTAGIGLGLISGFPGVKSFVPMGEIVYPRDTDSGVYSRNFQVFKQLYRSNKGNFKALNGILPG
jgi:xylulokinase